ncbi:MAG: PP0621 family protein [Pseudomonadota bacterium]
MGRLILILLVVVLVAWLLRRALAGRGAADADAGAPSGVPLVRCAHCGVNLPKTEARSAGGRHYCSEEHWRLGPRDG